MMSELFIHASGFILSFLLILWTIILFKVLRVFFKEKNSFLKIMCVMAVVSLAAMVFIYKVVPVKLKIFNDEVRLLSVSKSMAEENRCDIISSAFTKDGQLIILKRQIEKRPLLLPYLVSLLHKTRGYHIENIYGVNFVSAFLVLFIVGCVVSHFSGGPVWGISGMLFLLSQPVFSISATSGGMETLNLLFWVLSFLALYLFLSKPTTLNLTFLFLTLILLGHARYESALAIFLIFGLLIILKKIPVESLRKSYLYGIASILFLFPIFSQRWLMLKQQEPSGGSKEFSLGFIFNNNAIFFKDLIRFDLGVNNILNTLGVVSFLYFGLYYVRNRKRLAPLNSFFILVSYSTFITYWFIITSYYAGLIGGRFSARLFLPHLLFFSLSSVFLLFHIAKKNKLAGCGALAVGMFLFIHYLPSAVAGVGVEQSFYRRDYEKTVEFVQKAEDNDVVYICEFPEHLLINNFSAVSYKFLKNHKSEIQNLIHEHKIPTLEAVQVVRVEDQRIGKKTELPHYLERREKVGEFQRGPSTVFQVYKVGLKDSLSSKAA